MQNPALSRDVKEASASYLQCIDKCWMQSQAFAGSAPEGFGRGLAYLA